MLFGWRFHSAGSEATELFRRQDRQPTGDHLHREHQLQVLRRSTAARAVPQELHLDRRAKRQRKVERDRFHAVRVRLSKQEIKIQQAEQPDPFERHPSQPDVLQRDRAFRHSER